MPNKGDVQVTIKYREGQKKPFRVIPAVWYDGWQYDGGHYAWNTEAKMDIFFTPKVHDYKRLSRAVKRKHFLLEKVEMVRLTRALNQRDWDNPDWVQL